MQTIIVWLARVSAIVSVAGLSLFVIGNIQAMEKLPTLVEFVGLAFFPGGVLLGLLLGFKRPTYGGSVAVVSLLAFASWHIAVAGDLPKGPYFVIFTLPGLLFLAAGWLDKKAQAVAL